MVRSLRLRLALWLAPELLPELSPEDDPIFLPIWDSAHRPGWWCNGPLRRFLYQAHRKMKLAEAREQALARFGRVTPSTSSICRFWQRLDTLQDQRAPQPPKEVLR